MAQQKAPTPYKGGCFISLLISHSPELNIFKILQGSIVVDAFFSNLHILIG
jgi:hypothetical protein